MKIKFSLHGGKYVYASLYADDSRVYTTTGVTATPKEWASKELPKATQRRMDRIKLLVDEYIDKCVYANVKVLAQDVEAIIGTETGRVKVAKSDKVADVFERFLHGIISGDILNKDKKYKESSVKLFVAANSYIHYSELKDRPINEFTLTDFETFKKQIIKKELSQNTLSLYCTHLRTFFNRTNKMGWHKNEVLAGEGLFIPLDDIDTKVYVSSNDLAELYLQKVPKSIEQSRDCFVFGCHVGQRLSDLLMMHPSCRSGNKIDLSTIKKGRRVVIPMSPTSIEIWEKYKGRLPYVPDYTARVHRLFKELEWNQPTLYSYTVNGQKVSEYYKKWELISSHTMRRSFATNAYLALIPIPSIMKITGHTSVASFLKYICVDVEENADKLLEHEFFKL